MWPKKKKSTVQSNFNFIFNIHLSINVIDEWNFIILKGFLVLEIIALAIYFFKFFFLFFKLCLFPQWNHYIMSPCNFFPPTGVPYLYEVFRQHLPSPASHDQPPREQRTEEVQMSRVCQGLQVQTSPKRTHQNTLRSV